MNGFRGKPKTDADYEYYSDDYYYEYYEDEDIPDHWDWRDKGLVTPVKDQRMH